MTRFSKDGGFLLMVFVNTIIISHMYVAQSSVQQRVGASSFLNFQPHEIREGTSVVLLDQVRSMPWAPTFIQ